MVSGLLSHFAEGDDLGVAAEFLVVAIGDVVFDVEVLQQGQAHIDLDRDVLRQPDFVINASLLDEDARALVDAR